MIAYCRAAGILAVEMEAAALYALAQARQDQIICFAHVTNQMGQIEGDFEKGEASGSETALYVISQTARSWRHRGLSRQSRSDTHDLRVKVYAASSSTASKLEQALCASS
jgi:hypothetical protein